MFNQTCIVNHWLTAQPQGNKEPCHYGDVIMGAIASQITSLTIVYSTVYSDADERKHHSSASLAFVWGIHRGPVEWPVTRKMLPFDDVTSCHKFLSLGMDFTVFLATHTHDLKLYGLMLFHTSIRLSIHYIQGCHLGIDVVYNNPPWTVTSRLNMQVLYRLYDWWFFYWHVALLYWVLFINID